MSTEHFHLFTQSKLDTRCAQEYTWMAMDEEKLPRLLFVVVMIGQYEALLIWPFTCKIIYTSLN